MNIQMDQSLEEPLHLNSWNKPIHRSPSEMMNALMGCTTLCVCHSCGKLLLPSKDHSKMLCVLRRVKNLLVPIKKVQVMVIFKTEKVFLTLQRFLQEQVLYGFRYLQDDSDQWSMIFPNVTRHAQGRKPYRYLPPSYAI